MADLPFLCNIDLNQNQLLNPLFQIVGAFPNPLTLEEGQFFYNSSTSLPYFYNGTDILPFNYIAPGAITNTEISPVANIELSKLEVNPLDRALHSGTQLANTISDLEVTVQGYTLDSFAAPLGDIDLSNFNIINLADPVNPLDAVNLRTLQTAIQGIAAIKEPVRAATPNGTGNITLTGLQTIDNVSLIAGDRVLLRTQTNPAENGIWVVDGGTWSRAEDADETGELVGSSLVLVEEGDECGDRQFYLNTPDPIIIGTTGQDWVKFSSVSDIVDGDGLVRTGNTFNVVGTPGRIVVNPDSVDIDPTYVGQDSITTVGVLTSGTWEAGVIDAQYLDLSGVVQKYAETIGDGVQTSFAVNHNLNTRDLTISVRRVADSVGVQTCWTATSVNTVTFDFNSPPSANQYRVTIIG